jgi:hypothetical protein
MNVEYRAADSELLSFTTNASTAPSAAGRKLPAFVGKFAEVVLPVTNTLPSLPRATANA